MIEAVISTLPGSPEEAPPDPAGGALRRLRPALPEALRRQLRSAREVARDTPAPRFLPTCLEPFDRLLDGGLARGEVTEVWGRTSSGRFAAVVAALAGATHRGEAAALVDLGDGLDPRLAAAAGIELARLLWLRPRTCREALAAAEICLAGGFPLVVVDLGPPPVAGGRGAEAAWLRLARAAREEGAALLVAAPYRVSGTAAATVVELAPGRATWSGTGGGPGGGPGLLRTVGARLRLAKRRGSGGEGRAALELAASTAG